MGVKLTNEMITAAQDSAKKYGVPASITLAQIMLESGGSYDGGLSGLAYNYKNLFGMKGSGTRGSVSLPTKEYSGSGTIVTMQQFRKYNNFSESIDDHGKLLSNDRYTAATKNATTLAGYAQGLQNAGYATDNDYAAKLIKIINDNDLQRYDTSPGVSMAGGVSIVGDETGGLDIFGQIVRFFVIALLLILAAVLFLKAFDIKVGGLP